MDILLNVHGVTEGITESPRALLRIDRAGLLDLISKIEQVKALKAQDDSIYTIERWDRRHPVIWFDDSEYADDDGLCFSIRCPGHAEIPARLADQIQTEHDAGYSHNGDGTEIQSECEIMVTDDGSVHWTAMIKHCDVTLETSIIPLAALRAYAEKA